MKYSLLLYCDISTTHHFSGEAYFELNEFADMSPEEFSKTKLMPRRKVPLHPRERYTIYHDIVSFTSMLSQVSAGRTSTGLA